GGGAAGGASVGVAYVGTKPVRTGGSVTKASTAASGGADGLGQTTGAGVGAAGKVEDELAF
ncbi:MAG: hypothetical protein DYH12_34705, partial [Sorangiineae bacterium PRO1]|nr:hypothetical protein [Sorangiineae bacterium PRO1]